MLRSAVNDAGDQLAGFLVQRIQFPRLHALAKTAELSDWKIE